MSEDVKVRIIGDVKDAERAFHQAQAAAEQTFEAIGIAGGAAAGALALVEGQVISTSAMFERFATQLETIEGSSAKAQQSMDWISDFAKTTPYELEGITDAFVMLKAYGIDPVDGTLRTLGDTAAAMGKPLQQGVEALADAMTGEFERLKEFGIKASVVGDQVSFAYTQNGQQMTATADKNSQQMIQATLQGIWNDKYQGGMDKLSGTWDGMVSNAGDNWTMFQKQIGDEGAFLAAKNVLGLVLDELDKNDESVKELAGDISDVLITSMQIGVTGTALFAKGFAAMQMPIDAVRIGIDSVSLGAVQGFDLMLAGLEEFYGALEDLPGGLGEPYAQAKAGISDFRKELGHLEDGIKATGNESLNTFLDNSVETNRQWSEIDQKAQKVFDALEKGRNAPAAAAPSAGAPDAAPEKGGSGITATELAKAQKVIDIHSAKWDKIQAMSAVAYASEEEKLFAKQDFEFSQLEAEQARIEQAAIAQGASRESLAALEIYYDELKINRAQETADRLAEIDTLAEEERMQRLMDGEAAAYELKGQFQQLVTDNQRVNLDSMLGNIQAYSKASASWDKWSGDQKLGFAAATFGALSGLMASESRRQFEIGKAAAHSENIVHTYLAMTKALSTLGPIAGPVAATFIGAAGFANAAAIQEQEFGGGSKGGGGAVTMPTVSAGGGGATPTSPTNPDTGLPQRTGGKMDINWKMTIDATAATDPELFKKFADAMTNDYMPQFQEALDRNMGYGMVA